MKTIIFILIVFSVSTVVGCSETSDGDIVRIVPESQEQKIVYENNQTLPVNYTTHPPEGYLPWPHQNPEYTEQEYDQMINDLIFWSNFSNWQGSDKKEQSYLHSGLDIILPNGTIIYSVEAGTVRRIDAENNFGYKQILIEDLDDKKWGWEYVHTAHFFVNEGDTVEQGQAIAVVEFLTGEFEHLHLNRVRPAPEFINAEEPNTRWQRPLEIVSGQSFFHRPDELAPIIHPELYIIQNGLTEIVKASEQSIVTGDIDIAIAVRDDALNSRYAAVNAPSHITPKIIHYEITNAESRVVKQGQLNFDQLVVLNHNANPNSVEWDVESLYIHPYDVTNTPWTLLGFSYYKLTHFREINEQPDDYYYLIDTPNQFYWDTDQLDGENMPVYPNGDYKVNVYAEDFSGNHSEFSTILTVNN